MARRAPAVERSVAVLNFLASHPAERFTLSDIARECGLNKATLHAILAALTSSGYLVREPSRKAYGLGPALIAVGNAAVETHPVLDYARPEMQALSTELGLDCVASAAIRDEIVILERTGSSRPFGIDVRPGQRLPLAPPLGTVFVAWSGAEEIDRWLSRLGRVTTEKLARYRSAVAAVRERGYSAGLEPRRVMRGSRPSVNDLRNDEYALVELDRSASYRLNHIGVPVFGPQAEVVLALFLIGFRDQIPAEQVPRYAAKLRAAASRVTAAVGGREPGE